MTAAHAYRPIFGCFRRLLSPPLAIAALGLMLATSLPAQKVRKLADIRQFNSSPVRSNPFGFFRVGTRYVFTADTKGQYLWTSDGTEAGTKIITKVKVFGTYQWDYPFIALGTKAFFIGHAPADGREAWVTDGTEAGTHPIADLNPPTGGAFGRRVSMGSRVFFTMNQKLYITDGTAAGTVDLTSSRPGSPVVSMQYMAGGDKLCYFVAKTAQHGEELWCSDGTVQGTRLVTDWTPGAASTVWGTGQWCCAGDRLSYEAPDPKQPGRKLQLLTDGTAAGTIVLNGSGADRDPVFVLERHFDGTRLWLKGPHSDTKSYLWQSQLAAGDLQVLMDSRPQRIDGRAAFNWGKGIAFIANDASTGQEVWFSDGTPAGTHVLFETVPGPGGLWVKDANAVGQRIYLYAQGAVLGGLYVSDGTTAGTSRISNIIVSPSGPGHAGYRHIIPTSDQRLFLNAYLPGTISDPWITDGTPAGTRVLKAISKETDSHSSPSTAHALGDGFAYLAFDDQYWTEFRISSGTPWKTRLLKDIFPTKGTDRPEKVITGAGRLWFVVSLSSSNYQIWTSDGTTAGTRQVTQFPTASSNQRIQPLGTLGKELYFLAWTRDKGLELYVSDGTNSRLFYDSVVGMGFETYTSFCFTGGKLWFSHEHAGTKVAPLMMSDGSKPVHVQNAQGEPQVRGKIAGEGPFVWFEGEDALKKRGLWRSDGTAAGTQQVASFGQDPLAADGKVWFRTYDAPTNKSVLYVLTPASSQPVQLASLDRSLEWLGIWQDRALFKNGYGSDWDLWISDGTKAGTFKLHDRFDGGAMPIGARHLVYFDSPHYGEIWVSDGSTAGTRSLGPAEAFGAPVNGLLAAARGQLLVSGGFAANGVEPHLFSYGAGQSEAGEPCGGDGSVMRSDDPVLGKLVDIRGRYAPLQSVGLLVLGSPMGLPVPQLPGGCQLHVDPATIFAATPFVVTTGTWKEQLPLPAAPALTGVEFAMQCLYFAQGAPIRSTQGLQMRIGM